MKKLIIVCSLVVLSQFFIGGCANSKQAGKENVTESLTNNKSGGKYMLKFNPSVGTTGNLEMDIDMNIDMEMMGQQMNTKQSMQMGGAIEVVDNTEDAVTSKMNYKYFTMNMDVPMMGKMTYDSRKEDNEGMMAAAMDEAMKEMIGKEMTMVQSHSGKTISMEGIKAMEQLQQGNTNMNISSVLGMSQFPDKAVKVGESWKSEIGDKNSPYKFDATYTLKEVKDGKAIITIDSDVAMNPEIDENKVEATGKQTGTFTYNLENMWLIESIIQQDFDMSVEQMGMTLPMKMKGTVMLSME